MNIVQIHSGLGNQMFQYALYLALKHHSPDNKIDTSIYRYRPSHNGYELNRIFGIEADCVSPSERDMMVDVSKDIWSVIRRSLGFRRQGTGRIIQEPDPANGWWPEVLQSQNCYLCGYWQSEKYFASIADIVRKEFVFQPVLSNRDQAVADRMQSEQSVSIHVRRGDYIKPRRRDDYDVCSPAYYRRAITYIQGIVNHPQLYVFSDDLAWVTQQDIFPDGTIYIDGHTGNEAYIDMQLMSLCRHHIIANSSFSWWGAWLGQYDKTIVVGPSIWFRHRARPNILPTNWIAIDVD